MLNCTQIRGDFFADAVESATAPGGTFMFVARGGSMTPTIPDGARVVARRVSADAPLPGNIVVVRAGEFLRVHRLARTSFSSGGELLLHTIGDSLLYEDDPAVGRDFLGIVERIEKSDGRQVDFMNRRAAFAGRVYLALIPVKKILALFPFPGAMQGVLNRDNGTGRSILKSLYRGISMLPDRILSSAGECNRK